MARRALSKAASLIDGFNAMYDTIGRVQADREMRQIASAAPQVDEGFTDDQSQQLHAAANSGQYDIQYDEATKGYKLTAKSDPNAVGTIAPTQRTTFQGKTVAGTMDDTQVTKARQLAMANALERQGRLDEAGRLRDRVGAEEDRAFTRDRARTLAQREDWRFGQETKKVEEEDAYRTGMTSVIDGSVFGQRSKAFQEAMGKYEAEKKAYDAKVAAGESPGLAPTPPMQPTMTSAEKVLDAANVIAYKAKHGKASPEELMKVGEQMVALQQEGYGRMLQMAQQGAPLTAVVQAFNAQGKAQIDPSAIIEDKTVDRPGGVKSRLITYRLPGGGTQTIDTAAELTGLGKADELLKAAKQAHDQRIQEGQLRVQRGQLGVAQAREGREQAEFRANAPDREAKAAVAKLRTELAETTDPARQQELEAKIRALSTGARGNPAANEPADVKLARVAMSAGMFTDMKDALAWAVRNKDASPEKVRADLYAKALTTLGSPEAAKKATEEGMAYLYPGGAAATPGTPAKPAATKPASESAAHQEAQAAIKSGADKAAVNKRLQELGFKPLP